MVEATAVVDYGGADEDARATIAAVDKARAENARADAAAADPDAPDKPPVLVVPKEDQKIVALTEAEGAPWSFDMQNKKITPAFVGPMVKPEEMDREGKLGALYTRTAATDTKCIDMLSYIPSALDLAASIGVANEEVVTTLRVAAFRGGPDLMDGKVGDGVLVMTKIGEKLRLHFMMHQSSATMTAKEHFDEKLSDSTVTDAAGGKTKKHQYKLEMFRAYKSEHRVEGGYTMDGNYVELLYAHAEWQDTARVSSLFTAQAFASEKSTQAPPPKVEAKPCCSPKCCSAPKCSPFCCLTACCQKKEPEQEIKELDTASLEEKNNEALGLNRAMLQPELERYLKLYSEAVSDATASHPTKEGQQLKGSDQVKTLLKKLHTVHLAYRTRDMFGAEKVRTLVIVADPFQSDFDEVIKFTTVCQGFIFQQAEMEAEQKAAAEAKKQSMMERMFEKMIESGAEAAESTDGKGKKMFEKKGNQVAMSAPTMMAAMPEGPPPKAVLKDKDLAKWFKDYTGLQQPPLYVKAGAKANYGGMEAKMDTFSGTTVDKATCPQKAALAYWSYCFYYQACCIMPCTMKYCPNTVGPMCVSSCKMVYWRCVCPMECCKPPKEHQHSGAAVSVKVSPA